MWCMALVVPYIVHDVKHCLIALNLKPQVRQTAALLPFGEDPQNPPPEPLLGLSEAI